MNITYVIHSFKQLFKIPKIFKTLHFFSLCLGLFLATGFPNDSLLKYIGGLLVVTYFLSSFLVDKITKKYVDKLSHNNNALNK